MVLPQHHQKAPSNYAEYLAWDDDERWEMVHGVPYNMTPAPSTEHQNVISNLHGEFYTFLKGKECKSFVAPFDVRLFAEDKSDEEIINFVQPDISIICDKNKLDHKGCLGAPDLVIEVLSPSTAKKDRS
ncbi:MAG: Uma2 family endonuclease, partial [Tumebacillaceae bacterium]